MLKNTLTIAAYEKDTPDGPPGSGSLTGTPSSSDGRQPGRSGPLLVGERRKISIPKDLLVLLVDFMKTRKMAGHVCINFRDGAIVSVEAVTKKHYK